jgi:hypothetical protein
MKRKGLPLSCRPGVYVRLVAYLQIFADAIQLNAVRMVPLEDFNEITYHNLEAIYIHLLHTKGARAVGISPSRPHMSAPPPVTALLHSRRFRPHPAGIDLPRQQPSLRASRPTPCRSTTLEGP